MIAAAQRRSADARIEYRVCGFEKYEYLPEEWDCVISNLALHYIADLDAVYKKCIGHPTFTAGARQGWVYGQGGTPLCWPVDGLASA